MEDKINQILELVQVINNKTHKLEKDNSILNNQNERILKRIDDLERDISNLPSEVKAVKKNEFITIKDILNENKQIKKTTLYRYFQNHATNGLNVIQKDEGGTYTIKREDWDFWYNNQFMASFNFFDTEYEIKNVLTPNNDKTVEEQLSQIQEILEKKTKITEEIRTKQSIKYPKK